MFKTKEEALEVLIKSIPYSDQLSDLDLSRDNEIMFNWRINTRFVLNLESGYVQEVGDGILIGSDIAILISHIIKIYYINKK